MVLLWIPQKQESSDASLERIGRCASKLGGETRSKCFGYIQEMKEVSELILSRDRKNKTFIQPPVDLRDQESQLGRCCSRPGDRYHDTVLQTIARILGSKTDTNWSDMLGISQNKRSCQT